tara:strand:- start:69 stop:698 length:630 start_codon:yes stop_codon:yes gene_type:complete
MKRLNNRLNIHMLDRNANPLPNYVVIPNVLTEKECKGIIRYGTKHGNYSPGRIGGSDAQGKLNKEIRDTHLYWFTHTELEDKIANKICEANEQLWQYKIDTREFFQLGVYNPSGHYSWHQDSTDKVNQPMRKLSFTILLNDSRQYSGGKFQMHTTFDSKTGSPVVQTITKLNQTGSMILFPSSNYHRVMKVESGQRISLVGWCWGPRFT